MKINLIILILSFICLFVSAPADAQKVKGYMKSNGTYVQSYHRTSPNYTKINNYSTKGNFNPYTGKKGTQNLYPMKNYTKLPRNKSIKF